MVRMLKDSLKKLRNGFYSFYYRILGSEVVCNICGWEGKRFLSDSWHTGVICPKCNSSVRHRLLWAVLNSPQSNYAELLKNKRILHFAPEKCIRTVIEPLSAEYEAADLDKNGQQFGHVNYFMDISDMNQIEDKTFDFVMAFDVLEHVHNDKDALVEIHRVLKPGGLCFLTVPQKDHLEETDEDLTLNNPEDRKKRYGQSDHLRIYGEDFSSYLMAAGFQSDQLDEKLFDIQTVKVNVLAPPQRSPNALATNYRKVFIGTKE